MVIKVSIKDDELMPRINALKVAVLSFLILLQHLRASTAHHDHHLHHLQAQRLLVDEVNKNGPYIGLIMAFSTEETVLQSSGLFLPNSNFPFINLSGRRFNIGSIRGINVIYVMSGERRLNAGITVQVIVDAFDIRGIVHYGIAGSANNSLSFADVSIPKYVAYTGSWRWKRFESEEESELTELTFGDYNLPGKGGNVLAKVEFETEEFYSIGEPMKNVFWLEMDQTWFNVAAQLQGLKLQQCVNETHCLPTTPKVAYGLRASTSDIFVDNAAYRKFLFKEFEVSTVDQESAAVVMTAMSNAVPCIVFRGVSDLAGGDHSSWSTSLSSLAATNALAVAVEFVELIGKQNLAVKK